MNSEPANIMCLAFLHGETILFGMLLIAFVFWGTALALVVWKWRYLRMYRLRVIVAYLLLLAVPCLLLLSNSTDFFGFIFASALTLPWSLLLPGWLGEDLALAVSLFLCGVLNSVLFYLAASLIPSPTRDAAG